MSRSSRAKAIIRRGQDEICMLWCVDPSAAMLRVPSIRAAARAEANLIPGDLLRRQEVDQVLKAAQSKIRRVELYQARKRARLGY